MESKVFQFIGGTVERTVAGWLPGTVGSVIDAIQGIALVGTTIYIWLLGAQILFGQGNVRDLFGKGAKVVIVTAVALSVDSYGAWVMDTFEGLESGLAAALGTGTEGASIYATLDGALSQGMEVVNVAFRMGDEAGWNLGSWFAWTLTGIVVLIGTVVVALLGGATIILAKFWITLLFAVGPFYVLLLVWPMTARFFDAWFGSVVKWTLVVVVAATVMSFAVMTFGSFVSAADLNGNADISGDGAANPLLVAAEVFVVCFVLALLAWGSTAMAAEISGGMASAALSLRQAAMPVTMPAKMIAGAGSRMNPKLQRFDLQTESPKYARRLTHVARGNTALNPAYLQYITSQMGSQWSAGRGGKVEPKR